MQTNFSPSLSLSVQALESTNGHHFPGWKPFNLDGSVKKLLQWYRQDSEEQNATRAHSNGRHQHPDLKIREGSQNHDERTAPGRRISSRSHWMRKGHRQCQETLPGAEGLGEDIPSSLFPLLSTPQLTPTIGQIQLMSKGQERSPEGYLRGLQSRAEG